MKTIINQNQQGLYLKEGKVIKKLTAGVYKSYGFRNESVIVYPTTAQSMSFGTDVKSKDMTSFNVMTTVSVLIADPKALFLSGLTAFEHVDTLIRREFRSIAAEQSFKSLLENSINLDDMKLNEELTQAGLVASVIVSPYISLPRNLQNAIDAQEVARQRALAELEEARGRTAVLRHYANAAKVTEQNPDILKLLLGQKAKSIQIAFDANNKSK